MLIPNIGFGGAEKSFSKLSLLLAERYEVYVAVFNKQSYSDKTYPHGGTFVDLGVNTSGSIFRKAIAFAQRITRLRALKRKCHIDVTISFLEGADYINILAGGRDKKVLSMRGTKTYDRNTKGAIGWLRQKVLMRYLYRRADVIACVNKGIGYELKNDFKVKGAVRFREVFNYFDLPVMEQQARQALPAAAAPVFEYPVLVAQGRLSEDKGFQYLLDVFAAVKKKHKTARFVLVGDGGYRAALEVRCVHHGLSFGSEIKGQDVPDVYFAGFSDNPMAWLSKSTLFALPSFSEGFPNALAEAMIAGVPVVAADCPWGPRTILEGAPAPGEGFYFLDRAEYTANGVLLPMLDQPGAVDIWREAIDHMLANPEQRADMARHARLRMQDFSSARVAGQWYELLDELLTPDYRQDEVL